MSLKEIAKQIDQTLIEGLPVSLKQCLDDMLARGLQQADILDRVRSIVGNHFAGTQKGNLTLSAVKAYLESDPFTPPETKP